MTENKEYLNENIKVFLVDIICDASERQNSDFRMTELESLANTYGGLVVVKKIQKKDTPAYRTYVGKGKLEEIKAEMKETGANVLIFGNILKPSQIYNIDSELRDINATAWDRIDLILKIFEKNAKSIEARLQIELAAIRHMGPRIFGMGMELSRQGGGSKLARGVGETNTEIMRRHLKDKQIKIKDKLDEYKKTRSLHRQARLNSSLQTVGIVGYTNAGKSSLLNSLTKKGVLAENKLFATLGTSVGKMYVQINETRGTEILLNDTIGFIKDLPPDLIDAFSSTLEDSIESQILLHVVDCFDPQIEQKIDIVQKILKDIKANQPVIYVFNKVDLIDAGQKRELKQKFKLLRPVFVSAGAKIGLDDLKKEIAKKLEK